LLLWFVVIRLGNYFEKTPPIEAALSSYFRGISIYFLTWN